MKATRSDSLFHSLLWLRLPGKLSFSPDQLLRTEFDGRETRTRLASIWDVRVCPYVRGSGSGPNKSLSLAARLEVQTWTGHKRPQKEVEDQTAWHSLLFSSGKVVTEVRDELASVIKPALQREADEALRVLQNIADDAQPLFQENIYLKGSELSGWQKRQDAVVRPLPFARLEALSNHPLLQTDPLSKQLGQMLAHVIDLLSPNCRAREQHNRTVLTCKASEHARLFSQIEAHPLTDEQVEAAVSFDDVNVAVAAAGSGKTSVLVAKVAYALEANLFKDGEIVALAFNRDAARELRSRFEKRLTRALGRVVTVDACTFHSLALRFSRSDESGSRQAVHSLNSEVGRRLFLAAFDKLLEEAAFRDHLFEWVAFARYAEPSVSSDGDLTARERQYERACRIRLDRKLRRKIDGFKPCIPTLDSKLWVRSLEEASLANWLIVRGVEFGYEPPTFGALALAMGMGVSKKGTPIPYCPDFVYQNRHGERVYHEHFGVDEQGRAPRFLGKEYEDRVCQKRKAFRTHFGPTGSHLYLETTSGQMRTGKLFERLEEELKVRDIVVGEVNTAIRDRALAEFRKSSELEERFLAFLHLMGDSGRGPEEMSQLSRDERFGNYRSELFLKSAFQLNEAVRASYAEHGFMQFSDMLHGAIRKLKENPSLSPYRLILVDEFQDISRLRMRFVEQLATANNATLFFVGDDWQAINRFAGADISIFRTYVPDGNSQTAVREDGRGVRVTFLRNTFRCPQGLADVSRALVLENLTQIDKKILSPLQPATAGAVRVIIHQDDGPSRQNCLRAELRRLASLPGPKSCSEQLPRSSFCSGTGKTW